MRPLVHVCVLSTAYERTEATKTTELAFVMPRSLLHTTYYSTPRDLYSRFSSGEGAKGQKVPKQQSDTLCCEISAMCSRVHGASSVALWGAHYKGGTM